MVLRLVALVFALLIGLAGTATAANHDAPLSQATAAAELSGPDTVELPAADDLPGPSPAEVGSDLPALPMRGTPLADAGFLMAPPRRDAAPARRSPDLAGPQRPPCVTRFLA